jgi:hypothetical protein
MVLPVDRRARTGIFRPLLCMSSTTVIDSLRARLGDGAVRTDTETLALIWI